MLHPMGIANLEMKRVFLISKKKIYTDQNLAPLDSTVSSFGFPCEKTSPIYMRREQKDKRGDAHLHGIIIYLL